jgi:peptidoglycan/LPS O-acetylase OafA/YrhL
VTSASARRLEYIDGLRLVGAGAVLIQHLFERFHERWAHLLVDPGPGVFGVVLFFMISGFVIPFSVQRGLDVRAFVIRRITRIYPVYLVVLALALGFAFADVAPYFRQLLDARPGEWIANLLLVQDFTGARPFYSVSWTLAIEFIWYALFVCLVKTAGRRAGTISAVAAPALMIALTLVSVAIGVRIPLGRPGMVYAAVLGYQTYRYQVGDIGTRTWRVHLIVFLIVTLASNSVAFGYFHHPKISLMQAIGPWTAALILFALSVSIPAVRSRRGLANPTLAWLGAASYSIYMMHPLAIALAVHLETPILVIAAAVLLTFTMALLSYRYVELPGIRLGRALSTRLTFMPATVTALS